MLRYYVPGVAARDKRPDNPVTLADEEANGCIHRFVEEAGGRATDLDGRPLVFNQPSPLRPGMIASNGVLHDGLLALIREVAPPQRSR